MYISHIRIVGMLHIEETMKNWGVELTAEWKGLAKVEIQKGIFQGNALSPLIFVIAMKPLNHILQKYTSGYKQTKSQGNASYLMHMQIKKKIGTLGEKETYIIRENWKLTPSNK